MSNNELLKLAHTKPLTDERVRVAAAYWLDASPHERTEADGVILARYARQAMEEIHVLRQQSAAYRECLVDVIATYEGEGTDIQVARRMIRVARTVLDRYKDAQPEVQHECPCCGSDLDFYRDTATCPNDDCDYQAPYREDTQEGQEDA